MSGFEPQISSFGSDCRIN